MLSSSNIQTYWREHRLSDGECHRLSSITVSRSLLAGIHTLTEHRYRQGWYSIDLPWLVKLIPDPGVVELLTLYRSQCIHCHLQEYSHSDSFVTRAGGACVSMQEKFLGLLSLIKGRTMLAYASSSHCGRIEKLGRTGARIMRVARSG